MNYNEALEYIKRGTLHQWNLGLERVGELLELIGNPQNRLKYIHLAGTNGKGSVAAMLNSVLIEAGYKTGLYTSPFLIDFNERMQINNIPIEKNVFADIITGLEKYINIMKDPTTEFETITVAAFKYFADAGCDIVVLETGLGGEFDATNIIEAPEVAVMTNIGMDHMEYLGNTIEEIALTKSGIIKNGTDVVFYGENTAAEAVIKRICVKNNSKLHIPDYLQVKNIKTGPDGIKFDYAGHDDISIPLAGNHQYKNAAVAITALDILKNKGYKINNKIIKNGLEKTKWPGRFEFLLRSPVFIFDGAHNRQGAQAFRETMETVFPDRKASFIFGVLKDKDYKSILNELVPVAKKFYAVTPDSPRSLKAEELALVIDETEIPVVPCASVDEAVNGLLNAAGDNDIICATGSLFLYSDIVGSLKKIVENT